MTRWTHELAKACAITLTFCSGGSAPKTARVSRFGPRRRTHVELRYLRGCQRAAIDRDVIDRAGKQPTHPHPLPHVKSRAARKNGRRSRARGLCDVTVDVEG